MRPKLGCAIGCSDRFRWAEQPGVSAGRRLHPQRRQTLPDCRTPGSNVGQADRPIGPDAPCRLAVCTPLPVLYKLAVGLELPSPEGGAMTQADPDDSVADPAMSVLFATDGSDHALKAARFLAGILVPGAEIHLLTVLSMEMEPRTYLGELSDAAARRTRIDEETDEAVGETRRILEEAGHAVSVRQRFGNPPDETLSEVEELGPDLVVVGRRGLSRTAGLLLGSVSSFLLRHSPSPVLVVP